jgi:hypothetical protein
VSVDSVTAGRGDDAPGSHSPVRILAVGSMYPPHHQGGYELVWRATMRHARPAGHSVRVLASVHCEPSASSEEDPNVHRTLRLYWDWERYEFPRLSLRERVRLEREMLPNSVATSLPFVLT